MSVYGRLGKTGVGPFDESYFLSFDALADVVSFCRTSGRARCRQATGAVRPSRSGRRSPAWTHANVCSPDLALDRVSAFLLQLAPGTRPDDIRFALAQLPDVKIVEGNTVLTSSRQALEHAARSASPCSPRSSSSRC